MKKIIVFIMLIVPFALSAQNKEDTVITKDPLNAKREYWTIHNSAGIVRAQGFMLNGQKDGMWREYNDDKGKLTRIEEYSNGVLNGAVITFHINGSVTSDATYLNKKLNGESKTMNNYGNIKVIENYKDSVLNGRKRMYYDSFQLQEDGSYMNGQRDGLTKWYRSDGTLSMEHTYSEGTLQGPAKEYDDKGRIKRMGQFLNNNETGEWQEFEDSVLVKKFLYKDGAVVKEIPVKK